MRKIEQIVVQQFGSSLITDIVGLPCPGWIVGAIEQGDQCRVSQRRIAGPYPGPVIPIMHGKGPNGRVARNDSLAGNRLASAIGCENHAMIATSHIIAVARAIGEGRGPMRASVLQDHWHTRTIAIQ